MWNLPKVFTSGALFQAESVLTVRGVTDAAVKVEGRIISQTGEVVCIQSAETDREGHFSLSLLTPSASFKTYRIVLSNGQDEYTMENILFGELWLATGQSNMEMANWTMTDADMLYDAVANQNIRVYHVENIPHVEDGFPWEPDNTVYGWWTDANDRARLSAISACALKFSDELYTLLNSNREVPVGFLNASWGGTAISHWLPLDAINKDDYIRERMQQIDAYPRREEWNTKGVNNFQQTTCQYNVKIAPLEGVRVRGILWYQGESDCGWEKNRHIYADYLRFYHRVYSERFAADEQHFIMLSSLLYPWTYGDSGECHLGYLNNAFIETAVESPNKFTYVPINDLEPVWNFHDRYHPIHPANKYDVGQRMAKLAYAKVYNGALQKAPARLICWENLDNRLRLQFSPVGTGLVVRGERARGLYIAGMDGRYFPAEFIVSAPDTLDVWCEAVPNPCHAAYGVQSMEVKCNLFAGDYPVTPFFTDTERTLCIEARPWYDTSATSVWVRHGEILPEVQDVFFWPIWQPLAHSAVCQDTAFRRESSMSLRVCSDKDTFGFFVDSYMYNRLDFQLYTGLSVDLYNTQNLTAELILESDEGETCFLFEKKMDLSHGWFRYEVRFDKLPQADIHRMLFRFHQADTPYHFVNLERIRLL